MDTEFIDPYPAVPAELKALPQWVLWKAEIRNGKPTKIPYQTSGTKAKVNDPATWTDYQTACLQYSTGKGYSGIGFVFSEADGLCGIDLDNCLDANGKIKAWAQPIVDSLKKKAYGEVSPSGKGLKFFMAIVFPYTSRNKVYIYPDDDSDDAIEIYDTGRYFTITGKGKGEIVRDGCNATLDEIVANYMSIVANYMSKETQPNTSQSTTLNNNQPQTPLNLSSQQVIEKIRQSQQSHKFSALMQGNTSGYGSQSEADMALCAIVAFWTQDTHTIDTIFRQSKLMRDKWDEKHRAADGATYGQMTIEKALLQKRETYTPQTQRRQRDGFYQARARRRRYR